MSKENISKETDNVKRLGFCGVYAQSIFHAIEPNQCYAFGLFHKLI